MFDHTSTFINNPPLWIFFLSQPQFIYLILLQLFKTHILYGLYQFFEMVSFHELPTFSVDKYVHSLSNPL